MEKCKKLSTASLSQNLDVHAVGIISYNFWNNLKLGLDKNIMLKIASIYHYLGELDYPFSMFMPHIFDVSVKFSVWKK